MFIVFGTKETVKKKGERNNWCYICKNSMIEYYRAITWFTLFFIPIFPIIFRYYKVCTNCGNTETISKKQFYKELSEPNEITASPFSKEDIVDIIDENREITLIRKKRFYGFMDTIKCYVDNREVATLKNGQTVKISIENKECNLYAKISALNVEIKSNMLLLKPIDKNNTFYVKIKKQNIILSETEV